MDRRGSRRDSVQSREPHQDSPRENRSCIDPYIVPRSIDDSILLKDASRSYLTPTSIPAPVLNPHDRDALCSLPSCPKPAGTFKLTDVHPDRAKDPHVLIMQHTVRTPGLLPPLITTTRFSYPLGICSASISPPSTPSTHSSPSESSCPTPCPPPLPSGLLGSPSNRTTRLRPKRRTISEPEGFKDFEKFKNGNMRPPLTPTPPPPVYTQYSIGQGGGKKDPGAGTFWGRESGGTGADMV